MDTTIGMSLLLTEIAAPPFGGAFITFSEHPQVQKVDLTKSLRDKYDALAWSNWAMNTNFVVVFEGLILPIALRYELKPEELVKHIFLFRDMQFDKAQTGGYATYNNAFVRNNAWNMTSFERIQKKFADAGYEMPKLAFWNLAGGRAGYACDGGDGGPVGPSLSLWERVQQLSPVAIRRTC